MADRRIFVSNTEGDEVALTYETFRFGIELARAYGWESTGARLLGAGPHWPGWYEPQDLGMVVVDRDDARELGMALEQAFAELHYSRDGSLEKGVELLRLDEEERVALAELGELARGSTLVLSATPG